MTSQPWLEIAYIVCRFTSELSTIPHGCPTSVLEWNLGTA